MHRGRTDSRGRACGSPFSVLPVAIFHASFDAAINQLSDDVVPTANTARFLIFSAEIVLFATAVIIATKSRLGRPVDVVPVHEAGDAAGERTRRRCRKRMGSAGRLRWVAGAPTPSPACGHLVGACRQAAWSGHLRPNRKP